MKQINFLSLLFAMTFLLASCDREISCEKCLENNKAPFANAGPDIDIRWPANSVSLDGTNSNDPDGSITKWYWTKITGPNSINITNSASAITTVNYLEPGTYQFELKVTDNGGLFDTDTLLVTVNSSMPANQTPVANAGPDQLIILPANTAALDGMGSTDPDNNILVYSWSKIEGPDVYVMENTLSGLTSVRNLVYGVYKFELKVVDTEGLFSKDTVQITVDTTAANNVVIFNNVFWNDPHTCAMNIPNIYSYFPATSTIEVYIRWTDFLGNLGLWVPVRLPNMALPTDLFSYQIIGGTLKIHSIAIDCNFDDAQSYTVKIVVH